VELDAGLDLALLVMELVVCLVVGLLVPELAVG